MHKIFDEIGIFWRFCLHFTHIDDKSKKKSVIEFGEIKNHTFQKLLPPAYIFISLSCFLFQAILVYHFQQRLHHFFLPAIMNK